jgi:hypothetical protein
MLIAPTVQKVFLHLYGQPRRLSAIQQVNISHIQSKVRGLRHLILRHDLALVGSRGVR